MSVRPQWSYVQARLQARHGERLQEGDWRGVEAALSLDHYIERARTTVLRRFVDVVHAPMSSHAIERALRAAWRDYVAEVADWLPTEWQPATQWAAYVPDLPAIDALLKGDARDWMRQDLLLSTPAEGHANLLAPLTGAESGASLAARWYAHWLSLWPRGGKADARLLSELADIVRAHVKQLAAAGAQETSAPYRRELSRAVSRLFRRHGATAVAVFCHLILVALDLERLRGGLVRRRLFAPPLTRQAA